MSLSLLSQIVLRIVTDPNFQTENASIPWVKEDANWKIVGDAIRELATVPTDTTGFEEYNAGTTYSDGDFVAYNGNIYQYINNVPSAGVTPGTDPLYWELSSQGQFAHERNKDQYLDFGGPKQVSAQEIYDFINAVYPYLMQGTNTLTEDLNIYADGFTITILSGLNASESPRAKIIVVPAGAAIAYEDVGDPSQNSSFSATQRFAVVQGILQLNEAVELQSNAIYWKGNKDSPSEGDIREGYGLDPDTSEPALIVEKYDGADWVFSSSRVV